MKLAKEGSHKITSRYTKGRHWYAERVPSSGQGKHYKGKSSNRQKPKRK